MAEDGPPQIQIDDDWKAQAQAEKARLAEQEKRRKEQAAPPPPGPASDDPGSQPRQTLPPADFSGLVSMLASQAMVCLGMVPDPASGQRIVAMDTARHHLDLLTLLEDKTQGNLTQTESDQLAMTLFELRSRYVQVGEAIRPVHQ